jgi:uncharacterized membrane protein
MALRFRNKTATTVQVVIEWYDPSCGKFPWHKKGWWVLAPGQQKTVFGADLRTVNPIFYFYAEAVDGSLFWEGPVIECFPYQAFDWCSVTCNNFARDLGMRELIVSVGAVDKNVNLI